MLRVMFVGVLAIVLAACETVTVDPGVTRAALLTGLGIDPATVVHQEEARYAIGTAREEPVAFRSGLYVQTGTEVHLLRQKDGGKGYERDLSLPLDRIGGATVETWSHTHLKQLHLQVPPGLVVINFHGTPDAMAGDPEKTEAAQAALVKANVNAGKPSGRVWPERAATPYSEVYPVTVK